VNAYFQERKNAMKHSEICLAVEANQPVLVPDGFAKAVRQAAEAARFAGDLGPVQQWRINRATRNPRQLARIYAGTVHEAMAAGSLTDADDVYGFDWQSLLAFLKDFLPVILQIISIFS
jgi:hypothetical protein